ncbi:MAG: hypothetical protein AWU59_706 [Methanolobus sp. T82-4]|nr:MAG: hypothetical protein AWU59_706 [Methanolobus sp. T82-4]
MADSCRRTGPAGRTAGTAVLFYDFYIAHVFHALQYLFQSFRADIQFLGSLSHGKILYVQVFQYILDHMLTPEISSRYQNGLSTAGRQSMTRLQGIFQASGHQVWTSRQMPHSSKDKTQVHFRMLQVYICLQI